MSNYSFKAEITPENAVPGKKVHIEAVVTGAYDEVKAVYVSIPQYYITERLTDKGEGRYTLDYYVPWEAPSGSYNVEIYSISKNGSREQTISINYTLA